MHALHSQDIVVLGYEPCCCYRYQQARPCWARRAMA